MATTENLNPGDIAHDRYHDWIVGEEHSLDPRMVWATHVASGYRTLLLRTDLTPGPTPEDETPDWLRCPACNEPVDYCQGHGEIGDPDGFAVLEAHDHDDHRSCHPEAECFPEDAEARWYALNDGWVR